MVTPRFWAVLRLMTNSNLVGCSTGRSAGLRALEDACPRRWRRGGRGQAGSIHRTSDHQPRPIPWLVNTLGRCSWVANSVIGRPCILRRASPRTKSASGRALAVRANAPFRSCGPRTSCDWSRRPNAPAAACVSFHADALADSPHSRGPPRGRAGHDVLEEFQAFPHEVGTDQGTSPVMFPPGRARLATNPAPTGSIAVVMTIGIVWVAFLAARAAGVVLTMMQIDPELDHLGGELREALRVAFREPALEDEVPPFAIPSLTQPVQERIPQVGGWGCRLHVADPLDLARRLRLGGERRHEQTQG